MWLFLIFIFPTITPIRCNYNIYFCTSTVTLSSIGVVAADADAVAPATPVGLLFDLIDVADALLLAFEPRLELPKNKRPNDSHQFK